jgi:Quercetinase C-terminal cupin domain
MTLRRDDQRRRVRHRDQDSWLTFWASSLLESGQHVVHELPHGRSAWVHVVRGEAALGAIILARGDGAGVTADRAVSFTARAATENPDRRPRRTDFPVRGAAWRRGLEVEDAPLDSLAAKRTVGPGSSHGRWLRRMGRPPTPSNRTMTTSY